MFRIGKAVSQDLVTIYSSECSEEHYDNEVRQHEETDIISYINHKYNVYCKTFKRYKRSNGYYHYYFE